jgi:hypothetical protein
VFAIVCIIPYKFAYYVVNYVVGIYLLHLLALVFIIHSKTCIVCCQLCNWYLSFVCVSLTFSNSLIFFLHIMLPIM